MSKKIKSPLFPLINEARSIVFPLTESLLPLHPKIKKMKDNFICYNNHTFRIGTHTTRYSKLTKELEYFIDGKRICCTVCKHPVIKEIPRNEGFGGFSKYSLMNHIEKAKVLDKRSKEHSRKNFI